MQEKQDAKKPDPNCRYCKGKGFIDYQSTLSLDDIASVADCCCVGGNEDFIRQILGLSLRVYRAG